MRWPLTSQPFGCCLSGHTLLRPRPTPCPSRPRLSAQLPLGVNGGTAAASFCFVPKVVPGNTLIVEGGELARSRVTLRELKSAWKY